MRRSSDLPVVFTCKGIGNSELHLQLFLPGSRHHLTFPVSTFHHFGDGVWFPSRLIVSRKQFHSVSSALLFIKGTLHFQNFKEFLLLTTMRIIQGGKMTYQRKVTKFQIRSKGEKKGISGFH